MGRGSERSGIEQSEHFRVLAAPEEGLRLQDSELPCPFWTGAQESPIASLGLSLAVNQVAMLKSKLSMFKSGLRLISAATRERAGQEHRGQANGYGLVVPLAVVLPATTVPPPMQPRCMFSMFRVK